MTTFRPRRIASEIELIFKESTNLAAALVRALGISRSAELAPLSPIGIGDFLFDPIAFRGCVNVAVEMELSGQKVKMLNKVSDALPRLLLLAL